MNSDHLTLTERARLHSIATAMKHGIDADWWWDHYRDSYVGHGLMLRLAGEDFTRVMLSEAKAIGRKIVKVVKIVRGVS